VNLIRLLTSINVLFLAYMKREHCSQQHNVSHVVMHTNFFRPHTFFYNLFYTMGISFHIRCSTSIL